MYFAEKCVKYREILGKVMSNEINDVVLTTEETIKFLKISKPTYLKYIRLGKIKAVKAGNGWRVLQSELYRFLKGDAAQEPDRE
ncbi:MAG: helix-turn-helix domain-containing protein [Syntrophaceae bacterium]|nr:helix-turn-helix domain-containing protein [Syntrophaceae bacterium]